MNGWALVPLPVLDHMFCFAFIIPGLFINFPL